MIVELGHFALILALAMALLQASVPLIGAARGQGALMALAFTMLFVTLWLIRIRSAIIARKIRAMRQAESEAPGRFAARAGAATEPAQ